MNPSTANSEVAGIGSLVFSPRITLTGSPNSQPAISNSETPHASYQLATFARTGSWPKLMTTGQGFPWLQYFSRINRPCLPGEIQMPNVFLSCTQTRYVPTL